MTIIYEHFPCVGTEQSRDVAPCATLSKCMVIRGRGTRVYLVEVGGHEGVLIMAGDWPGRTESRSARASPRAPR